MLFVDDIVKIVRLGIASSYLKDEKNYLNLMLLSYPEAGKSSILLHFRFDKLKSVFTFTDLTKTKLEKLLKDFTGNPHKIKYVIVPDFTRLKSHGRETEKGIIGLLNSGIEEGIREITSYYGGSMHETIPFKEPVFFGMASSMTRYYSEDRRRTKYWVGIGFLSRFLPVSFTYSKEQIKKIREYIQVGNDLFDEPEKLKLKEMCVECPQELISQLDPYVDKLLNEAYAMFGFRYTRQFRLMLKANALLRESNLVEQQDLDEVKKLMRYINLDYNEVI